ncbi:extracellular solute-binding protein [Gorillibacterium massiliense]|uniref:extracellular solute-binding protein n=1 Tax=Gorillibacterium massiliense TaxID=1280390 RepID=UPI0004BC331C|nr:extracellular solute-binding protein [Gorillibacterium massiliense]
MWKTIKGMLAGLCVLALAVSFTGCGSSKANEAKKVVIYTNADDEAVAAMETALKNAGYENKYLVKALGTSELGGKLMAEGSKIEADLVTMSSYFIDSSQAKYSMYKNLDFDTGAIETYPAFYTPILANTGSIFVNTDVLKQKNLPMPTSIKDLTKPEYKDQVSIPNIMSSSTAWLLVQAIITQYGEDEGKTILHDLIANVGPHLESSGSGPIKKVQAGEVAVGFGLRHQAVKAKAEGAPIDYVDPVEGNFSLTESIAVVDKKNATTDLAMKMAQTIIKDARKDLISYYPVALYKGESVEDINKPAKPMKFTQPLTVDLLEKHQNFFKEAQ